MLGLQLDHITLDESLGRTGAEIIATTTATLKLSEAPQLWYVVRLN